MKPTFSALFLVFAIGSGAAAYAEPVDLGSGFSVSGSATVANDYRFRGYSQTNFRPAAQVEVELAHSSGFYLGNWNSNVAGTGSLSPGANIDMNFYGGWRGDMGEGVGLLDVGVMQYRYPGSQAPNGGSIRNTDLYIGLTQGPYSLKYSYTPGDFFSRPDSHGTWYLDASANFDLIDGWAVVGHLGYQRLKNVVNRHGNTLRHYIDYKLGVTKQYEGWTLGVAAVGVTEDNFYATQSGDNAGRLGVLASVSRAF